MPGKDDYAELLKSFSSDRFRTLRPSQTVVLRQYSAQFTEERDVAIELPTGSGKTLIALLVAEAWRCSGNKVAILSANKTLARQLRQEAQDLGVPAVLMEGRGIDIPARDKRAYQRASCVAIMNYWVYFNQNPVIDHADLLVMDDAHLAEHCLHSLYSTEISRYGHPILFATLVSELQARFPEYSVLADAAANDTHPTGVTDLLSFIDQVEVADRIRDIIDASPEMASDKDLGFRWGRTRSNLREANIYVGTDSIWIRPYVYPLISNEYYAGARQRLYLSATVGDPGDLSRRLGVGPINLIPVPPGYANETLGRRLIVMNRIEEADIPERLAQVILACLRVQPKSVWLCSSETEARHYQALFSAWLNAYGLGGHPTWILTPLGDEIDHFKSARAGHLFVAGRFDGMDFKADECRLVVLTTLPRAINGQEEFISAYLRDSGFMTRRLNQRIVQSLGRCNRSPDDYGVYILADRRFATHFGRESSREGIPRNIVAEIDMAQDSAELPIDDLLDEVNAFVRTDFSQYDTSLADSSKWVPVSATDSATSDTSKEEVLGWANLYASHNYIAAADHFEKCWEAARCAKLLEVAALYGWQWAKALYLQSLLNDPSAREKALSILEMAIKRGGRSSWFNRLRASLNRITHRPPQSGAGLIDHYRDELIRNFDWVLERVGQTGTGFERWCRSIGEGLESPRHASFQEGLEKLGQALGYHAARPRYDSATDCIWRGVFGNAREVVTFEAKIEQDPSGHVSASAVGQAHNQAARAEAEYGPHGYLVRGTIVTHLSSLTGDAEASAGPIRVIQKTAILALWARVSLVLSLYRDQWSLHDIAARQGAARSIWARLPPSGWLTRALDLPHRFVSAEQLLAEWPDLDVDDHTRQCPENAGS